MGTKISDLTPNSNPNKDSEIVIAHNGLNAKVKLSELSDIVAPVQIGGGLSKNSEGALRVSAEAAFFVLLVNSNGTAHEHTQDMTYTDGSINAVWKIADLKFGTLRDALHFAQNNFSAGASVKIVVETDITEIRSSHYNHYDMRNFTCTIDVVGSQYYGLQAIDQNLPFTTDNVGSRNTVTISGQNALTNNMILWNGSGSLGFQGIKFDIQDVNHNGGMYGVFRSENRGNTHVIGVKMKISGSSTYPMPKILEARDGGQMTVRVAHGFGTGLQAADPMIQGFALNALELDLASYAGGFSSILDSAAGGVMRIIEYNGHIYASSGLSSEWTFNANICFTTDADIKLSTVSVTQSSIFEANGPVFTKANGVTIYIANSAIHARQYASISMSDTKDFGSNESDSVGGTSSPGIPGTSLYNAEAVSIADYVQSGTFGLTLLIATPSTK